MLTIKKILRTDRLDSKGEAPLYIRLTKNRRSSFLSLGIKLAPIFWDVQKEVVKKSHPNAVTLNTLIRKLELELESKIHAAQNEDLLTSAKKIKNKLTGIYNAEFFSIAASIAEKHSSKKSIGTRDKVLSITRKIKAYCKSTTLPLADIDINFLNKYERYCLTIKQNNQNTINRDLTFIRQVFNQAKREGLIDSTLSPFNNYQIRAVKTERAILTPDELSRISSLTLPRGALITRHRDMFIFACYAGGLRVSDLLLLKWDNIKEGRVYLVMRKTNHQTTIFLNETAKRIINEQTDKNRRYIFGLIDDDIDTQNAEEIDKAIAGATVLMNRNLKKIAELANIGKTVTTHVARHTFATLALQKGISIPIVQKILGHANIRETQIYAKIMNTSMDEALAKFDV